MEKINFTVSRVFVSEEHTEVILYDQQGRELSLTLFGEPCCSASFFPKDSIEDLRGLIGETIETLEEIDVSANNGDGEYYKREGWTYFHYYALKIRTSRGELTVDWRNASEGSYDGACRVALDGTALLGEVNEFLYERS
jgi:hypothetical protein